MAGWGYSTGAQWLPYQTANSALEALFAMRAVRKAAGWTVPCSSDGTTYNAAGDQITHEGSGAGGMGNNRAWWVESKPGDGLHLCFQIVSAATCTVRAKWSPLPFDSGSPDATRVPAATDEQLLYYASGTDSVTSLGAGTDAAPTGTAWFQSAAPYEIAGGADGAAPYGYWFCAWKNNGIEMAHIVDPMLNPAVEDAVPYVLVAERGVDGLSYTKLGDRSGNVVHRYDEAEEAWVACGLTLVTTYHEGIAPYNAVNFRTPDVKLAAIVPHWAHHYDTAPAAKKFKGTSGSLAWVAADSATVPGANTLSWRSTRDMICLSAGQLVAPWDGSEAAAHAGDVSLYGAQPPADAVPPTLSLVALPTKPHEPYVLDVSDVAPGLRSVELWEKRADMAGARLIYNGTGFEWPFAGTRSGARITVYRADGWPVGVATSIYRRAIDMAGNQVGD